MKKYLIILLMAMLPTLALAQQAGQHITRPNKPSTTTTKPPKKQAPPKKQTAPKPPKKQSHSQSVGTERAQPAPRPQTSVRTDAAGNRIYTIGNVQFTMIKVEGGTFTMPSSQTIRYIGEFKEIAHQVTISSFYIGQTEVTQALWKAVMGSSPSYFSGENRPVECVSWNDCQEFLHKLNSLTGENFKLPTEAQWEFAARGGNKSKGFDFAGSNILDVVAWFENNSGNETHSVATKQANELGIYDMSGNVYEWCNDWHGNYTSNSQIDPIGPTSGSYRVLRGGSWYNNHRFRGNDCNVSCRLYDTPKDRINYIGLRIVLS